MEGWLCSLRGARSWIIWEGYIFVGQVLFWGRRQERPGASKVAVLAQSLGADFDPTKMDVTDVEDLFGMIFLEFFGMCSFLVGDSLKVLFFLYLKHPQRLK